MRCDETIGYILLFSCPLPGNQGTMYNCHLCIFYVLLVEVSWCACIKMLVHVACACHNPIILTTTRSVSKPLLSMCREPSFRGSLKLESSIPPSKYRQRPEWEYLGSTRVLLHQPLTSPATVKHNVRHQFHHCPTVKTRARYTKTNMTSTMNTGQYKRV